MSTRRVSRGYWIAQSELRGAQHRDSKSPNSSSDLWHFHCPGSQSSAGVGLLGSATLHDTNAGVQQMTETTLELARLWLHGRCQAVQLRPETLSSWRHHWGTSNMLSMCSWLSPGRIPLKSMPHCFYNVLHISSFNNASSHGPNAITISVPMLWVQVDI
jgi:hypothetical protein